MTFPKKAGRTDPGGREGKAAPESQRLSRPLLSMSRWILIRYQKNNMKASNFFCKPMSSSVQSKSLTLGRGTSPKSHVSHSHPGVETAFLFPVKEDFE